MSLSASTISSPEKSSTFISSSSSCPGPIGDSVAVGSDPLPCDETETAKNKTPFSLSTL